jgi:hypothetical protein
VNIHVLLCLIFIFSFVSHEFFYKNEEEKPQKLSAFVSRLCKLIIKIRTDFLFSRDLTECKGIIMQNLGNKFPLRVMSDC